MAIFCFGAGEQNRTAILTLARSRNSHYTTPARVPRKGIGPSTTAFSEQCSTTELPRRYKVHMCGRYRTRTYDPLSVNEMLYQLS